MSYLISQMYIQLLVALALGFLIGWLIRSCCKCKTCRKKDSKPAATPPSEPAETLPDIEEAAEAATSLVEPVAQMVERIQTEVDLTSQAYAIETIEGIGPKLGERLRKIDICTVKDVLENCGTQDDRQKQADRLGVKRELFDEWASMADLLRIKGLDQQSSELLFKSDVFTVGDLGKEDPHSLVARMQRTNTAGKQMIAPSVPTSEEVSNWVAQAKRLNKVVEL